MFKFKESLLIPSGGTYSPPAGNELRQQTTGKTIDKYTLKHMESFKTWAAAGTLFDPTSRFGRDRLSFR